MIDDRPTINHLSLCAGIGGIDLGLREVVEGCRTVAYVEIEAFAVAHLVAQMEAGGLDSAPVFTDLHDFPWGKFAGLVDIVSGGFPCQPFSHAGKRDGVDDPRHLWPTIARGVGVVQPVCVFFENVDGVASAKSPGYHSVLHHVLCDLEGLGYLTTAGVFTASEVGAPHQRRRWFILGVRYSDSDGEPDRAEHAEAPRMPGDLADGDGGRQQKLSEAQHEDGGDAPRNHAGGCDAGLADTRFERGKIPAGWKNATKQVAGGESATGGTGQQPPVSGWPAGPGQMQYGWEQPRTIEPGVGGATDGVPFRVDRLRVLGNAVVPAVAARAFTTLFGELTR